jgi:hypothetical protein
MTKSKATLFPQLELVHLPLGKVIYESGQTTYKQS